MQEFYKPLPQMEDKYDYLVAEYKKFRLNNPIKVYSNSVDNKTKWEVIEQCKGLDIEGILNVIKNNSQLLDHWDAVQDDINWLLANKHDDFIAIVNRLVKQENIFLETRIINYNKEVANLHKDVLDAKSERTASVILACYNSQRYTPYMKQVYDNLRIYLKDENAPKKTGYLYSYFLNLLVPIVSRLKKDVDLYTSLRNVFNKEKPSDLMLAQDVCWTFFNNKERERNGLKELVFPNITNNVMESPLITQYKNFLQNNHNMIFTGAPGTGKTYLAKQIAASIIGCSVEELRENKHFGFVQFHPSYDYTDFVEGLRPSEEEGKEFELRQGIFKQFCATALEKNTSFDEAYTRLLEDVQALDKPMAVITPTGASFGITLNSNGNLNLHTGEKMQKNGVLTAEALKAMANNQPTYPYWQGYYKGVVELLKQKYGLQVCDNEDNSDYVFVIDEINRGEISKIFGELFYSIDPGYRGEVGSVKTQYQNMVKDGPFTNGFYVPKNVYIIGTMNDIDRSVESLDFAFRRRFPSVEIGYNETLESICEQLKDKAIVEEAKERLRHLNDEILKDESLGAEYCIGGSYLLKLNEIQNSFEKLWRYYLQPVIAEYFRGLPSVEKAEKLNTLKNAFLG